VCKEPCFPPARSRLYTNYMVVTWAEGGCGFDFVLFLKEKKEEKRLFVKGGVYCQGIRAPVSCLFVCFYDDRVFYRQGSDRPTKCLGERSTMVFAVQVPALGRSGFTMLDG
jgi:hypothetical protein